MMTYQDELTTDDFTVELSMTTIGAMWRELTRTQMVVFMLDEALGPDRPHTKAAEVIAECMGVGTETVRGARDDMMAMAMEGVARAHKVEEPPMSCGRITRMQVAILVHALRPDLDPSEIYDAMAGANLEKAVQNIRALGSLPDP